MLLRTPNHFVVLFLAIAPIVAFGGHQIAVANAKSVTDLDSGEVRWTDARYAHIQSDGRITIDKSAPLSQWPHAVRIYKAPDYTTSEGGPIPVKPENRLWVTIYPEPIASTHVTLN